MSEKPVKEPRKPRAKKEEPTDTIVEKNAKPKLVKEKNVAKEPKIKEPKPKAKRPGPKIETMEKMRDGLNAKIEKMKEASKETK